MVTCKLFTGMESTSHDETDGNTGPVTRSGSMEALPTSSVQSSSTNPSMLHDSKISRLHSNFIALHVARFNLVKFLLYLLYLLWYFIV